MKQFTVTFVRASDVLTGPDAEAIYDAVGMFYTWGDTSHTLIRKEYVARAVKDVQEDVTFSQEFLDLPEGMMIDMEN
jgi:hypothetical protein